ncbi:hypothetical protein [Endozoicomonas sp.]|uniref:hypothetical protein n=1 Tax=Endozoicomonas sp. TaxID=1892382 RepID=UPI003AF4FE0C
MVFIGACWCTVKAGGVDFIGCVWEYWFCRLISAVDAGMSKKTKIRTIHELPEWFDLSRYKDLRTCSNYELSYDLKRRHRIFHNTFYSLADKRKKFWDIEDYPLKRHFPSEVGLEYDEWRDLFRSQTADHDSNRTTSSTLSFTGKDKEIERLKDDDVFADMWDNSVLNSVRSTLVRPATSNDISSMLIEDRLERGYELNMESGFFRYDDLYKGIFHKSKALILVDLNSTNNQLRGALSE